MVRVILIRPGTTDFDVQGRIKGNLDIPLNAKGATEVARTARELAEMPIEFFYTSPCQSAEQTAEALSSVNGGKVKRLEQLANLDHGLWQGKRIDEVRRNQPKVYRMWQDHPESVCPPEGESLEAAQRRVHSAVEKLLKKNKSSVIAIVTPEPLASVLSSYLRQTHLGDLWKAECSCGSWEIIDLKENRLVASVPT